MKLRTLGALIKVSPIAMTVFGIFYPPILFVWAGLSILIAAVVVYPDELGAVIHSVLVSIGPWSNEAVTTVLQNGRPIAFVTVLIFAALFIGPVILLVLIWWSDEALDSLVEDLGDSAE